MSKDVIRKDFIKKDVFWNDVRKNDIIWNDVRKRTYSTRMMLTPNYLHDETKYVAL
jgi:hypothetical protein